MRPWHLGNTTVRSPFRLREGLVALASSPLQGALHGKDAERAFRKLLGESGIVELGDDESFSVGRKWRSALSKLGFLYPEIPKSSRLSQLALGGADVITPNGMRLVNATSVPAMQECFLRALAAYYIPSIVESKGYKFSSFSPLRHTLRVLLALEKEVGDGRLNFIEMALVVQLSSADDSLNEIVKKIIRLRRKRGEAANKKAFDRELRGEAAKRHSYAASTFNDYADTNFRYLKATGLVQSKGRGITIVPEKRVFIEQLIAKDSGAPSGIEYFSTLCNGAVLPTDSLDSARLVLDDLLAQLKARHIPYTTKGKLLKTAADIAIVRHEVEGLIADQKEEQYARSQAAEWEEIAAYMGLIIERKRSAVLSNGDEIEVPQSEAPAYFEWIMWRAFLAIDSLKNRPYKVRRFKIDQDFLPVGTAAGGGPDLVAEFERFLVAVEVTLTENSRQEAAEGEPVRRHVADLVLNNRGKAVYGLFVANRIDSNTAETFRIGCWYLPDDSKMRLDIVPLTLSQFRDFFVSMFSADQVDVDLLKEFLDKCGELRNGADGAPSWKVNIHKALQEKVSYFSGGD